MPIAPSRFLFLSSVLLLLAGEHVLAFSMARTGSVRHAPHRRAAAAAATRRFSTATATTTEVDRNVYNLPLDVIAEEWTAEVVPESALRETGIYLGARSSRDIQVDTVPVVLARRPGEGLGLELLEIAGGRDDGLGIVVVDGIVPGGIADGSAVMVGDSIAAVTVVRRGAGGSGSENGLAEQELRVSVECECFGYEKLVDALSSLPPAVSDDERVILTVKRLRRKAKVTVRLQYPPHENEPDLTLELFAGENLRRALLTRGVKLNDPLSRRFDSGGIGDCGAEGTCATCVVNVVEGGDLLNPQKIQEAQILVKNPRWRLACRAVVGFGDREGGMTVRVNPRQWGDYQKAAATTTVQ